MDRRYIDEHHIVERYLAEQLTDDEREVFEAYYLDHPEILKELETVARFKAGMILLQRSGELDRLLRIRRRFSRARDLITSLCTRVGSRFAIGDKSVRIPRGSGLRRK